jgi:hypothetical protein
MVLITLLLLVIVRLVMAVLLMALLTWLHPRLSGATADELASDRGRLRDLDVHMRLFFRLTEQSLASRLRAPTHPYLNELLRKLYDDTISVNETRTLHRLIQEHSSALVSEGIERPDPEFPRILTKWSLEARLSMAGARQTRAAVGRTWGADDVC